MHPQEALTAALCMSLHHALKCACRQYCLCVQHLLIVQGNACSLGFSLFADRIG